MRKLLYSAVALASLSTICSAQTITETFGYGPNAFSIDFVTIGNPGNAADTEVDWLGNSYVAGSVGYTYGLGKYEVSRDMINKVNTASSLGITISDMTSNGGNRGNIPATEVNWYEAAKFVNWLNVHQGHQAAYKFAYAFQTWNPSDVGYQASNPVRNSLARYVLPTRDEWYKGAYYDPNKAGGAGYWDYPTGSDVAPTSGVVYGQSSATGPADIANAGVLSPYGTMAQGGNVWEWNESTYLGSGNNEIRGGSWVSNASALTPLISIEDAPWGGGYNIGFRVAMIPEPSALSLLAFGLGGLVVALRGRT